MGSVLTADDVERYQRDGILFPLPALDEVEVVDYRARLEELERRLGGRIGAMQVVQPQLHFRWAYDLATRPRVLAAVAELIGPDVLVHSATVFVKHPGDGSYVPWHQDGYYWQLSEPRLVSAWIALSASTPESGCLRVVPGSHRHRLAHREQPEEASLLASGLRLDQEIDTTGARDVRLEPGQMSLHHERIVHGSDPNRSAEKRIGFAIRYVAPAVAMRVAHHEVILARGRDDHGLYDHLAGPPGDDLEEGLARQRAFIEVNRRRRLGRGVHDLPGAARRTPG